MKYTWRLFIPIVLLVLLCTTLAVAQEDELINEYMQFNIIPSIIQTIVWSTGYLVIYIVALMAPLAFLRQFHGLDTEMIIWVVLLWVGGLITNAVVYSITGHHFLAGLIAVPLLFGWTVLISTRSFADLIWQDAMIVGVVVALLCAPWFGPTWRVKSAPKPIPIEEESRMIAPVMTKLAAIGIPCWPVES